MLHISQIIFNFRLLLDYLDYHYIIVKYKWIC